MRLALASLCAFVLATAPLAAAPKKPAAKAAPAAAPAASTEEVNALALTAGAYPRSSDGSDPGPLGDGSVEVSGSFEPSKTSPTVTVTYRLAEPFDLTRAEVVNSANEADYPGISTKRLRLESATAEDGPWTRLAEVTLQKGTRPQAIAIPKVNGVRWVRATLLESYGESDWWSLAELRAFGRRTAPRQVRFNGSWDTDYGQMVLTQTGERVTGCYGSDEKAGDALVEGTVEGPVFFGTWVEYGSDGTVGGQGTFSFALTAEGGIAGVWGHQADGSDRTARWDGQPRAKATITCEKPERHLADDLKDGRAVLRGILFDTGKDVIRPESEPVLEALAAAMQTDPARRWLIEGHTDDRGGAAYNLGLSDQRAKAVRAWLVKAGVEGQRLETKGFGMSRPTLPNDSEAGRAANRRVEVSAIE